MLICQRPECQTTAGCKCQNNQLNVKSGWSCPRCGRVYSPDTQVCQPCNSKITMGQLFPARTNWDAGASRCPMCHGDQTLSVYDDASGVAILHKCGHCKGQGFVIA
jgi:hypothetical protein